MPNDFIAKAEAAPGSPFVNFHFHTPTLNRLVLHQINQLNYLETAPVTAAAPASSSEENGSEAAAAPPRRVLGIHHGYGTNTLGAGKTVLLDFSSPNIAKPFHAGHLRSTIIGMFCANIYTASGWNAIKMNYLGDWGKQYGILAIGFERYGSEEKLLADPIKHLYDLYVQINDDARAEVAALIEGERKRLTEEAEAKGEKATVIGNDKVPVELTPELEVQRSEKEWADAQSKIHSAARQLFRRMEDGEPDALAIWKRFRDLSILKYKEIYARLNIEFDVYWGESQVQQKSQDDAVAELERRGLVHTDQGALLCQVSKKLGKVLIRKRDGATLYMTRDIGGAQERYDTYKFDKVSPSGPVNRGKVPELMHPATPSQSIYVVANQQELHFQQLFEICKQMEYPWAKDLQHVG